MANKTDVINFIAENSENLTKAQAIEAVDLFLDAIVGTLEAGDKLQLVGYLTVEPVARSARKGFNPQTGEEIDIQAKVGVKVTAGKKLKTAVQGLDVSDFVK